MLLPTEWQKKPPKLAEGSRYVAVDGDNGWRICIQSESGRTFSFAPLEFVRYVNYETCVNAILELEAERWPAGATQD